MLLLFVEQGIIIKTEREDMGMIKNVTDNVHYVGVDDKTIDLFQGQYVVPNGVSYNSYVIMDDKIAIMDMVDKRKASDWLENLSQVLGEKKPDYLVR